LIHEHFRSHKFIETGELISRLEILVEKKQLETFSDFTARASELIKQLIPFLCMQKTILLFDSAERCSPGMLEWFAEFVVEPIVETHNQRFL